MQGAELRRNNRRKQRQRQNWDRQPPLVTEVVVAMVAGEGVETLPFVLLPPLKVGAKISPAVRVKKSRN